jgi:CHAP domain
MSFRAARITSGSRRVRVNAEPGTHRMWGESAQFCAVGQLPRPNPSANPVGGMEAKEHPHVSSRDARTRPVQGRLKLGGMLAGATMMSAIAVGLTTASTAPLFQASPSAPVQATEVKLLAYPQAAYAAGGAGAAPEAGTRWTPSAADALRLALAQVGVTENADGGGTIYQKWFVSSPWAVRGVERYGGSVGDYANASWCDMFISWIGDQLGVTGMGADAFTPAHAQWFKDQGRWGQTPTPGAVVFFSWSGGKSVGDIDHVGMVIKDDHDGTIQTVEGNTDNAVEVRTRDVSSVVGYGYPDYAPARFR